MYSVEDLLISHGYKLPKNAPSPCETARYADCQREMAETGSGHGTANGYETDTGAYVCSRQAPAKGYCSDNECKDRNQRRKAGSGNQGDTQPLGDFLTRDSGFYDGARGMYSQPRGERGVSYWRRRGQDFSVLLDYADCRELRGSGFARPVEGALRVLGEERGHERQCWDETEREAGQDQWRVTGDRNCQSLGAEEWRQPVALGQQLSDGEGERWAQDQRRIGASEGGTKGKSLSLPRVLSPESLQYTSMPDQSAYGGHRLNGSLSHRLPRTHHSREWWAENGHWPSSHGALLPKPRFSRPLKPPSYEAHQQTRGSSEMLAGDQGPQPKDKGPYIPRQDYFSQEPVGPGMEPPVYIPPPSYERPLLQRGAQKNYSNVSDFRLKGMPFQQVPRSAESGRWFSRQAGSSWLEQPREQSAPCRKQSQLSSSLIDLELQTLTDYGPRGRGPKKSPPGKEAAEPQPLQPNPNNHNELLYSGSWPGDQYRDQETQTSCPAAPKGAPQGPRDQQAQDQGPSSSDTTTDSGMGTDCSTFGYPMKGQKSLNPSSNSAFSRTANFPSKLCKSPAQPPSGSQVEAGRPLARTIEDKPLPANGQEAFGQFLLKPVSRRPWDAIEELESFNNELQSQMCKRASVDQCIEDLDQAYRDILELGTTSDNHKNGKVLNHDCDPQGEEPPKKPNKTQHTFESWSNTGELEPREKRSAFSKPPAKTVSFGKLPNEPGFRDYSLLNQKIPLGDCRSLRSDIPVLRESLLRDVGLTVYTETPGEHRQPTQDASTLTSPPDYEDVCHALQLSRERAAVVDYKAGNIGAVSHSSFRSFGLSVGPVQQEPSISGVEAERTVRKENLVSRYSGENEVKGQGDSFHYRGRQFSVAESAADRGTYREVSPVFDEEDSDRFDWQKQLLLAEKHLEELLINEKANSLPKEDLSNLYEVQCAEGIPEKETIEERAARILGIEVPAESLAVRDQKADTEAAELIGATESDPVMTLETWESSANGKLWQVQSWYEEVSEEPVDPTGPRQKAEVVMEPGEGDHLSRTLEKHVGLDCGLPEFPPGELLGAISSSDDELPLSISGDMEGPGASPMAEHPQDGTAHSSPLEETENLVLQAKEEDFVPCMDNLDIRSLDSGEESEDEDEGDRVDNGTPTSEPDPNDTLLSTPHPQPRNATVAKREITLPLELSDSSHEAEQSDEEVLPLSEPYDPSRVERV
ncbi:hypothetical protein AAFF_G00039950 [Aldrovandia affinis]|uniref:Junctional protein associated with coronary artery disease n=1 Tax=Aldrovandia affinis TaxID=143900 RepID=A0AAD7S320_9TELE|nr:hypothetical protein AAFF_G00039950 [Aldrovandia affinis]